MKKGHKFTEQHRVNLSNARKGSIPWNKGMRGICFNTGRTHFRKGGPGYWLGKKRDNETKNKMSIASKGRKCSEETKKKISLANKGKHFKHSGSFKCGEKHHCWKGGKSMQEGYVLIYCPKHLRNVNGYIFEHRLVMEKYLSRYLKPEERVHHLNGVKTDNRIENLKLFPNESEHQKFHFKNKCKSLLSPTKI